MEGESTYRFWRGVTRLILGTSCRIHTLHPERANADGAWLLASNHISHFDPPLLSIASGRCLDWMAMEELFRNRWVGSLLTSVMAFPVKRFRPDRASLRLALDRLRSGRVVGIFPEGGIRAGATSILEGAPLRPGAALLASMSESPVTPSVILGSDRLYQWRQWLPWQRTSIWIAFGQPLPTAGRSRREIDQDLASAVIALYQETIRHFHLTSDDLPKTPQHRKGDE